MDSKRKYALSLIFEIKFGKLKPLRAKKAIKSLQKDITNHWDTLISSSQESPSKITFKVWLSERYYFEIFGKKSIRIGAKGKIKKWEPLKLAKLGDLAISI